MPQMPPEGPPPVSSHCCTGFRPGRGTGPMSTCCLHLGLMSETTRPSLFLGTFFQLTF